ncbi:MAG: matrixin family metalloprotease [Planctomycetes bacterium]|nr:matrixin family metalloprotease [Planctomycetota bacterium]
MAKVVVLSNRTTHSVTATLLPTSRSTTSITIAPGESRPVFFEKALRIRYQEGRVQREFKLDESNAYFFTHGSQARSVRLEKIGLGDSPAPMDSKAEGQPKLGAEAPTIRVKLLVDDDEPTHQQIWESRLRKRFAAAADIIERHSGVRMVVDSVSTWDSEDTTIDFNQSLREFEKKVTPKPAQLAIGFSSQYRISRGRIHMGGTRGALHPYILLKERSPQVRETERLEMLVHEMGHHLGAAHSPEPYSVMRPLITGGQQRAVGSRIRFDPVNTLLMAMVGEEIRSRRLRSLASLPEAKKKRMAEIYGVLVKVMPEDPAAAHYQRILGHKKSSSLVGHTRQILNQLVTVAQLRRKAKYKLQKNKTSSNDTLPASTNNDAATNSYVRQAALEAQRLKSNNANRAFLLALGIFMDETATLRTLPPSSKFVRQVETDAERIMHLQVLGAPTMRGRQDLVKHFFVSAFIVAMMGDQAAQGVGLAKELADAHRGSGFSFADMAANQAGIIFAERLLNGQLTLAKVAQKFSCEAFLPPIDDLAENLSIEELKLRFGGTNQKSLQVELNRIEDRILELPIYRKAKPTTSD